MFTILLMGKVGFEQVSVKTDCAFSFSTLQKYFLCLHNSFHLKEIQNSFQYEYSTMHFGLPIPYGEVTASGYWWETCFPPIVC